MTREEALDQLSASSSSERFRAAYELSKLALTEDLATLLRARMHERDAFVLRQLDATIAICSKHQGPPKPRASNDYDVDEDPLLRVRAQATEWIAGILLHEIGSKLGLVALSASKEIPDYETSKTQRFIKNLQAIFDAIEQLKSATIQPRMEQFDLFELIEDVENVEIDGKNTEVLFVGMRPFVITGGRQLIRLALSNGIRNAVEAVGVQTQKGDTGRNSHVTITWGVTDKDYWISIIDTGPGLSDSARPSFGIGNTTKDGHPGFGLPIAKQALETLGGDLSLTSSTGGGAKFEMRWKK